jgi:hypothetical protein
VGGIRLSLPVYRGELTSELVAAVQLLHRDRYTKQGIAAKLEMPESVATKILRGFKTTADSHGCQ